MTANHTQPSGDDFRLAALDRYWFGDATPDEVAAVEAWFAEQPEWRQRYGQLRERFESNADAARSPERVNRTIEKVLQQTRAQNAPSRHRRGSRSGVMQWAVAAGAAACVAFGVYWGTQYRSANQSQGQANSYATGTGEHATITLRDGTTVALAPQTTLSIEAGYGEGQRTVRVAGEAFFTVVTAERLPFTVRAGGTATSVLGTAFAVRYYESESQIQVSVQSGKVQTSASRGDVTLTAGAVAVVTDSGVVVSKGADLRQYIDWTQGTLVFERTPVPQFLAELGRWYGYEFQLADSALAARKISVAVKIGDPADVFTVLKAGLDVTIAVDDDVVTLTPRSERKGTRSVVPSAVPARTDVFHSSLEQGR